MLLTYLIISDLYSNIFRRRPYDFSYFIKSN